MFAACGFASADSILTGTCTSVTHPTELTSANGVITCTQFNLNPTWLQSITLTLDGSIAGSISLTNNGVSGQTGKGTTDSTFFLTSATCTSLTGFSFAGCATGLFDPSFTTGIQTVNAGQTLNFTGLLSGVAALASTDSNGATFGAYEGAGTFGLTANTLTGLGVSGGGGQLAAAQVTTATFTATISYDYIVPTVNGTPEPATMALFGSALVGLGLLRKRIGSK